MGLFNYQQPIAKNMQMIDTFGGLNKRFRIAENEFSDIFNMTADDYPVLSTRKPSQYLRYSEKNMGVLPSTLPSDTSSIVFVEDVPAVLTINGDFFFKNEKIKIENCSNNKLIRIGNILYAFPSGVLIKLPKNNDDNVVVERTEVQLNFGYMYEDRAHIYMEFAPANIESVGNCTYFDENKEYEIGEYCWKESEKGYVLERFCGEEKGWEGMIGSLIRIETLVNYSEDERKERYPARKLSVGDVIFIEDTIKMNGAYLVEYIEDNAIYVQGHVDVIKKEEKGRIERRMPELDYVVEHSGRLWGCRSGYSSSADNQYVNEIYATALNSLTNWYRFQGTSQDSYAMSLTSNGKFTGAAVVGGYITFFKENCIHRIYGTLPENFQIYTTDCCGIQENCEDSIVLINGMAYYKSPTGIMVMSEGLPVKISDKLGIDNFVSAFAGTDGKKYYISMTDINNERFIYVYDPESGIWHKEDCASSIDFFVNYRNSLYAFSKEHIFSKELILKIKAKIREFEEIIKENNNNIIIGIANASIKFLSALIVAGKIETGELLCLSDNSKAVMPEYYNDSEYEFTVDGYLEKERDISWFFETADIGYSFYNKKHISKVIAKMKLDKNSHVDVEIEYNNDGLWHSLGSIIGDSDLKSESFVFIPARCENFKLKFHGTGNMHLISFACIYEEGSDV